MSEFWRKIMVANKTEPPITKDYLTIVALEDGLTAKLSLNACEYCVDGDGNWKSLPADTETEVINAGHTLSFRGNLTPTSNNGIGTFTVNKYFNLKGNCMSMLFGDDAKDCFSLAGKNYAFYNLFKGNDKLVNVSKSFLPATTVSDYCYNKMFSSCKSLFCPPELPAMTTKQLCYQVMFENCTSLMESPKLPATNLSFACYNGMFSGCTLLTKVQTLPALKLSSHCYQRMFQNCTSLINAPELIATTLTANCYNGIFINCSKLDCIKMLATDISAIDCLTNWVDGVAEDGTFVKNKDATWDVRGASGIPNGWEVITE